jgi:transposase InsO family protein
MERIAIDILERDSGNRYIVVISDYTKWTESHPMPNMEASTVANILITQVVTRFGIPSVMHSDQGGQFESQLFTEMCSLLQIQKTRTTPYHPKSDGMVERFNKTLATMLTGYVNEYHSN